MKIMDSHENFEDFHENPSFPWKSIIFMKMMDFMEFLKIPIKSIIFMNFHDNSWKWWIFMECWVFHDIRNGITWNIGIPGSHRNQGTLNRIETSKYQFGIPNIKISISWSTILDFRFQNFTFRNPILCILKSGTQRILTDSNGDQLFPQPNPTLGDSVTVSSRSLARAGRLARISSACQDKH